MPDNVIENADAAVAYAQQVRQFHARRTSRKSAQRTADINVALARLKEAMAPLKREIGRFPYGPQTSIAEANRQRIRDASCAIQTERRKLWKMQDPATR
jgi:hypothetical protein